MASNRCLLEAVPARCCIKHVAGASRNSSAASFGVPASPTAHHLCGQAYRQRPPHSGTPRKLSFTGACRILGNFNGADMFEFIARLIGGIVEFILDVLLFRKIREAKKRPTRSWSADATDVAYLDWWLLPVSALAAMACAAILFFGLGLPFWLSFGGPTVLAGLYCGYKYLELLRR